MGAEDALRAAGDGVPLRGVIADGAGASTLGDMRETTSGPLAPVTLSATWLAFRAAALISGDERARAAEGRGPPDPGTRPADRLQRRG